MKKSLIGFSALIVMLLSGCGGEETCRFDMQVSLDKGEFERVVDRLENDASCRAEYGGDDYMVDLGVAYMGKAGLGVTDIIVAASESSESGSSATFGTFVNTVGASRSDSALQDLDRAVTNFEGYLAGTECNSTTLTSGQKDVCLYQGLSDTMSAAVTFDYLTDDIDSWVEQNASAENDVNANGNPDDLDASACALQLAVLDNGVCAENVTATHESNVTFSNGRSYGFVDVDVTDGALAVERFFHLMTLVDPKSTVITEGYCTTDFVYAADINATPDTNASLYPCPVDQSDDPANELSVADLLVSTLNDGLDTILALVGGDEQLQADITAFVTEISPDDGNITITEILDYLNQP